MKKLDRGLATNFPTVVLPISDMFELYLFMAERDSRRPKNGKNIRKIKTKKLAWSP